MKSALFLVYILAIFTVGFVSAAHAYADAKNLGQINFCQDMEAEADKDDTNGCHGVSIFSASILLLTALVLNVPESYDDGIKKRPPRA